MFVLCIVISSLPHRDGLRVSLEVSNVNLPYRLPISSREGPRSRKVRYGAVTILHWSTFREEVKSSDFTGIYAWDAV